MPFVVGETIGPYRILEQLGRGGMATVFKAYHAALDRYVAIKALHPAFLEDPNFHARFQREARVVAKLEHPNIVPIYDFAEYEDRPYLVMKFIEGQTLKARLASDHISQDELLRIIQAVGDGLAYAHQQGILHRDIKPSNVLLAEDGRIYLADFGLARIAQAGESTLSGDMMLGTPQYISPEQAMGLGELDERTDIYSFGVMLYELVVGQVPFSADTPFSIIHDHIYTPLPLPQIVNPDTPEAVERVLLKALAKEPGDRYRSIHELVSAFSNAAEGALPEAVEEPINDDETYIPPPGGVPETINAELVPSASDETAVDESAEGTHEADEGPKMERTKPEETVEIKAAADISIEKPKRRIRWWMIVLLTIVFCGCSLLGLGAVLDILEGDTASINLPGQDALIKRSPFRKDRDFLEGMSSLEEAQGFVDSTPDDPLAWYELASAQWNAGLVPKARNSLDRARQLSADNMDAAVDIATRLSEHGFWVEASRFYLLVLHNHEGVPDEIVDRFRASVYWAAEFDEAEKQIPISAIAEYDPALERVVRARYLYYQDQPEEAQAIVDELLHEIAPGLPEALFLQAEMEYVRGDDEKAIDILIELITRSDTPSWISNFVHDLFDETLYKLDEARAFTVENPDDPWGYLMLMDAALAMGRYPEAEQAIKQALSKDQGDPEVSKTAGDLAAGHGVWPYAAHLYVHSAMMHEDPPLDLVEHIEEAFYFSAVFPDGLENLPDPESALPNELREWLYPLLIDSTKARNMLHNGKSTEAMDLISIVLEHTPNYPMARLVQAEAFFVLGDVEKGVIHLDKIIENPTMPTWAQEEAQSMLNNTMR